MNTLQIHLDQFRHTPGNTKKEASFMEQKLKQDIQIGETIRSLRMERKLTQDQVVSKLQLMDLDITRSQTAAYGSRHHPEHLLSD